MILKMVLFFIMSFFCMALSLYAQSGEAGSYDPKLAKAVEGLGKRYALLIGVEYAPPFTLDWTAKDAEMIANTFNGVYGFETILLIGAENTTREKIRNALGQLKRKARGTGDQVVVFFSGHGRKDPDNPEMGYLMPSDGDIDNLFSSGIHMNVFESLSKSLKARQALFIVDACFSGIIGGFTNMSYERNHESGALVVSYMGMKARQVLTAGRSQEKAWMSSDKRMSLYSFYLHRALNPEGGRIRADLTGDHVVTVRELQEYLESKVVADSAGKQNPRIFDYTANDGQFVFAPSSWPPEEKRLNTKQGKKHRKSDDFPRKFRSNRLGLSYDDIKDMLAKHNFFDKMLNPFGDFENDFKDNKDGTVTDLMTGLIWQQSGSKKYMEYHKALKYIDTLNQKKFAGYNDWRLPTIEELASLIESMTMDGGLYIDPSFDKRQESCWSGDKSSFGSMWSANFVHGLLYTDTFIFINVDHYVRAVRSKK